jgi:hypothetical protein
VFLRYCSPPSSFNVGFAVPADHANPKCPQACWIVHFDDLYWWQQRIIGTDVRRIFGGLLDGFHFFFASGVIERTYDDRLSKKDVAGR